MKQINEPPSPDWEAIYDNAVSKIIWKEAIKNRPDFIKYMKKNYPLEYIRITKDL